MASSIRDIPTDRGPGKMAAAVRPGDRPSCRVFTAYTWLPVAIIVVLDVAVGLYPFATGALGMGEGAWAARMGLPVFAGASGHELITVLRNTGLLTLAWMLLAVLALILSQEQGEGHSAHKLSPSGEGRPSVI